MTAIVTVVSLLCIGLGAYAFAPLQRTMGALDLFSSGMCADPAESRARNQVLGRISLRNLNAAFVCGIAVYDFTSRASTWQRGAAIVSLCAVAAILILFSHALRPRSPAMLALLKAELRHQREWSRASNDAIRLRGRGSPAHVPAHNAARRAVAESAVVEFGVNAVQPRHAHG